ncbi:unnamed protein product [Ceratitis capitata]|uniref:(Mediterranean fruit fly) hypothetical protein n=1 Tax=Ceratitis capitata TaxID=7213 RepID=A0A811ULT5_CERCA|nr:unnamed protein product [Ceratitis capitata]
MRIYGISSVDPTESLHIPLYIKRMRVLYICIYLLSSVYMNNYAHKFIHVASYASMFTFSHVCDSEKFIVDQNEQPLKMPSCFLHTNSNIVHIRIHIHTSVHT